jgi:hypothetical protein
VAVRIPRRLPGFRFEVQPPPLTEVLPRMDVAVFVGFAASGPLHVPVPVEDAAHFAALFGDDALLAWDAQRGESVYAYLAPAVRAFFRNGGRRCWVVRVAGAAQANYFPLPGLARLRADGTLSPAFARARSPGSWSDPFQAATALLSLPVRLTAAPLTDPVVFLDPASQQDVAAGDLLRLTFPDEGYVLQCVVGALPPAAPGGSPLTGKVVPVRGDQALWFQDAGRRQPPSRSAHVQVFTHQGEKTPLTASVAAWPTPGGDPTVRLNVDGALADAPPPGSLVRVDFGALRFWLAVQDVRAAQGGGSPAGEAVALSGQGLWQMDRPPRPLPAAPATAERLTFELWARRDDGYPAHLSDLGFAAAHPRFWGALPTDAELYQNADTAPPTAQEALRREAADPRFPLAGTGGAKEAFFPLLMSVLPDSFLGPDPLADSPLKRDGLDRFDARLFLDARDDRVLRALVEADVTDFLAEADYLRYQGPALDRLRGIYAALDVPEATLIAVPDAVHRGWSFSAPTDPLPSAGPAGPAGPGPTPPRGGFLTCELAAAPPAPHLARRQKDPATDITLFWVPPAGARSVLQEATLPDFSDAVTVFSGAGDQFTLYGRRPGDFFYRVRAEVGGVAGDWSNVVAIRVDPASGWRLNPVEAYTPDTLLVVQRALLRLCAARGDLFAALALPEHYREDEAAAHVATLASPAGPAFLLAAGTGGLPAHSFPLSAGEADALSYGAVYHPWPIGPEEDQPDVLRRTPPDGAACGVLARRALARGAWVAPANEPLSGVVALTPEIPRQRRPDLYQAQVNLIGQEPHGFVALGADTLSADEDLRPINVRRLLILLRRLALRLGAAYVFEPNDDSLLRSVQRGFEGMLEFLLARGAFAGTGPAAFQVVAGSPPNTPADRDQGRFLVELRVAPARPMTFLTVRLVQAGDRGTVTEVR